MEKVQGLILDFVPSAANEGQKCAMVGGWLASAANR
jgi:hypothetical protein